MFFNFQFNDSDLLLYFTREFYYQFSISKSVPIRLFYPLIMHLQPCPPLFILQVWTNGITHPKWKGSMVEEMKCFIKITFAKRWLSKGTNVTLGCKWMFIVSSLTDLWILGSHDTVRLYRQSQSDHSLLFKHLG